MEAGDGDIQSKIYNPRIADRLLTDAVERKDAVLVNGLVFCGKTTTALQIAKAPYT